MQDLLDNVARRHREIPLGIKSCIELGDLVNDHLPLVLQLSGHTDSIDDEDGYFGVSFLLIPAVSTGASSPPPVTALSANELASMLIEKCVLVCDWFGSVIPFRLARHTNPSALRCLFLNACDTLNMGEAMLCGCPGVASTFKDLAIVCWATPVWSKAAKG